ncbi:hypothetical protein [Cognatishimia sp. F0-27]|uniref:hypothetical protein n=1 Tax=Cognatishimia sp. F0-27 TaxID=2816855 RepID=UPI001D0C0741|nr:hypothetical protein [Cognatishimia sp. F0-27]MCC1494653.1 hypothetical protein [Cognatishimia sp. F0-27]
MIHTNHVTDRLFFGWLIVATWLILAPAVALSESSGLATHENTLLLPSAQNAVPNTLLIDQGSASGSRVVFEDDPASTRSGLSRIEAGRILQSGWNHLAELSILGTDHRFAVSQTGVSNQLGLFLAGRSQDVVIKQGSSGNIASVSMSGAENRVVIQQD